MSAQGLAISADVRAGVRSTAGRASRPDQRALDLLVAGLALVLLSPLMAILALAVWLEDGVSPFYGQYRMGRGGQPFRCWKFRSMVPDADVRLRELLCSCAMARAEWSRNQKLRSDPRVTRLGRLLRSSSLDEPPQLWNVLAGDMSLVGPRPIVASEVQRYAQRYRLYCACRPGMTGLWQISGRSDVDYRRRVALDTLYVKRRCLWLDLSIMLRTIPAVLMRKGCY